MKNNILLVIFFIECKTFVSCMRNIKHRYFEKCISDKFLVSVGFVLFSSWGAIFQVYGGFETYVLVVGKVERNM